MSASSVLSSLFAVARSEPTEHRRSRRVCLALLIVAFAGVMLYGPVRDCYVAYRTQGILSERLAMLKKSNVQLSANISKLESRQGIERAARNLDYVGKGETAVEVSGVEAADKNAATASSDTMMHDVARPWYICVLDVLFGYHLPS